jgi:hypothetical protein
MTATPMSDLGVDAETGEYGDQTTDVIRRYIECGELRLTAGGARELAAALVAAADKLDARRQLARRGAPLRARGWRGAARSTVLNHRGDKSWASSSASASGSARTRRRPV